MNVVHLIGYLGRDPDVRTFPEGDRVVTVSLATHKRRSPAADGSRRERTDWHRIRVYGPQEGGMPDILLTYAGKGSRVRVQGELTATSMIDNQGRRIPLTFVDVRPNQGALELMDPPRSGNRDDKPATGKSARHDPLEQDHGLIDDDLL